MNDDCRITGRRQLAPAGRMKHCCLVLAAVAAMAAPGSVLRAADANAVLHWSSGDSLPGRLTRITADELTWESAIFATPLQLQRSVLASVSFEPGDIPVPTTDDFRIALHNGDVLFGTLHELDDQHLAVTSSRHGDVQIPRDLIAGIERINREGLIYLGPVGREGWAAAGIENNWREETDGSLTSSTADALLTRKLRQETKLAVEIILAFTRRPDFVLALGRDDEKSLRLESWDDALVVCNQLDFLEVQQLRDDTVSVHLLLYVDMESGRMLVCSPQGEVLAKLEELDPKRIPRALSLRNGSGQVTLQHLRIERWDGTTVGSLVTGRTGLQQVDGGLTYGIVQSIAEGQVIVQTETDSISIPVEDVGSLVISGINDKQPVQSIEPLPRIKWRDGGMLYGDIVNMTESAATLQTSWSSTPVAANPLGIKLVEFAGRTAVAGGPDELIVSGRLLHGHLVVDAGEQPVTWKPTGSATGVALRSGDNAVVTRSTKASGVSIDPTEYPDTIYLHNNDIIPCRLDSITENAVRLSSPFASAREFPSKDIKALELSSTRQRSSQGFADDAWKRVRGRINKDGDSVELKTGSFGHADGMLSDRLMFQANWPAEQWTIMTVHLFADDLRRPTTSSTCTLMFSDSNVIVTQNFDRQNPFAAMQNPKSRIQTKGTTAEIQLVTSRGKMEILINGKSVDEYPLERAGAGNAGVLFELSQVGNGQFFGRRRARDAAKNNAKTVKHLTLANLQTGMPGGASIQKFIDDETRLHTLTIPRFRRDDPPTHALIAPNGDVLRGRLIAINSDSVEFESRLEVFRFPRERVATVVWIQNPEKKRGPGEAVGEAETTPRDAAVLQTVLNGGFLVSMTPARLSDGQLHGESSVLGHCSVPANAISRLYLGNPEQRKDTAAYSQWRAKHALEPDWDIAQSDGGNSAGSELIGHLAPDFELPQLDGKTFRLSEHAGRIVILDFWATWCGPCVAALPDYVDATKHFDESELVFVAVNLEESPQQIRAFLKEHELNVRVAVDGSSEVAAQYNVNGIPHSLVISPEGTIEYVHVGYDPDAGSEIQRVAEAILSGSWSREATSNQEIDTPAE
ncbi:MAG: TlpA disulfide reductase family protein [Planctomycetaceae bacterium]